jgi:PIN domain nuclease of toxin-antitoxin system
LDLLLDTHALIWWLAGDDRLSPPAKAAVMDESQKVFVSAASLWEIATKSRLGKLPGMAAVALEAEVAAQGFAPLPITLRHGQMAGALPGDHRDPFDRMLIAQAMAEGLALVSNETAFDFYGVRRVW